MPGGAFDLIQLPVGFWDRDDTRQALRARDVGELFHLVRRHGGASQTRISVAVGIPQGKVSEIMNGKRHVVNLEVMERLAAGLDMTDPARMALGLAPRSASCPVTGRMPSAEPDDGVGSWGSAVPAGAELVVAADPAGVIALGRSLPEALVAHLMTYLGSLASDGMLVAPQERDRAYDRLVQSLQSWAHTVDRRDLLRVLGLAATAAAALDSDAPQRLVSVLSTATRVDTPAIEHIEAVLGHCLQQDRALGPQAVLDTVLAQRDLARALLPKCPATLRPRLLSVLSTASRRAGWLSFDLQRFDHAGYYYEDARALAHDAENTALGSLVLCQMSKLAIGQGRPRTGIDHAVAAGQWAQHTDDMRLRAYAADMAARSYAADGQKGLCLAALDTAHTALTAASDHNPSSAETYDEALHISFCGECHLKLRDSERAIDSAQRSLQILNPSGVRDRAHTLIDLGTAYVQCKEVDEAAQMLGEAGDLAAGHSSARLTERLKQGRAELEPWKHTTAVRQLDDRLTSHSTA